MTHSTDFTGTANCRYRFSRSRQVEQRGTGEAKRISQARAVRVSVPPEAMAMLRQQQQQGGQPGAQPGAPRPGPTGQMPQPQEKEGLKEAARVNIHIAMNMLEQALPVFGSETKEGKNVLKALNQLAKDFGDSDTSDLHPAEIRQMVGAMPQSGGGSEVQKMLMQAAQRGQGGQPQPQ